MALPVFMNPDESLMLGGAHVTVRLARGRPVLYSTVNYTVHGYTNQPPSRCLFLIDAHADRPQKV
jgi:hypothetical protein